MQELLKDFHSDYLLFHFNRATESGKTGVWDVRSKQHQVLLGQIKWYGHWRQYIFKPQYDTLFNVGCMNDVIAAINKLMNNHRGEKQ